MRFLPIRETNVSRYHAKRGYFNHFFYYLDLSELRNPRFKLGIASLGFALLGLTWLGLVWLGMAWHGLA